MEYVRLGKTGLKVSRLCLGCMSYGNPEWNNWHWVRNEEESRPFIKAALDAGINFFDTANYYSLGASEEVVGRALNDMIPRDQVVIATKVRLAMGDAPTQVGLSRKHIHDQIDSSLRRLGTDYVDLLQIHRWDYETPIEETLEALNDIVRAGKVRYIGASSMWAWQFMKALGISRAKGWAEFVSMQNFYNLAYREEEREMIPLCISEGIGLIPWSPVARGFLAGNRPKGTDPATARAQSDHIGEGYFGTDQDYRVLDAVTSVAERLGVTNYQVALAWILRQPGITSPIIGATKPHHLGEATAALDLELDEATCAELEAPYVTRPVQGHQ